jgi:hypothetical protein
MAWRPTANRPSMGFFAEFPVDVPVHGNLLPKTGSPTTQPTANKINGLQQKCRSPFFFVDAN